MSGAEVIKRLIKYYKILTDKMRRMWAVVIPAYF
jgi:hypothetical protein